jgi:hypothetical protein
MRVFKVRTRMTDLAVMSIAHQVVMPLFFIQLVIYFLDFKQFNPMTGSNGGEGMVIFTAMLFNVFERVTSVLIFTWLAVWAYMAMKRVRVQFLPQELTIDGDSIIERYEDEEEHRALISNIYAFVETKKRFIYFRTSGYSNAFRKNLLSEEEQEAFRGALMHKRAAFASVVSRRWKPLLLLWVLGWTPILFWPSYHDVRTMNDPEVYASADQVVVVQQTLHRGVKDVFWTNASNNLAGRPPVQPRERQGVDVATFKAGSWTRCESLALPQNVYGFRQEGGAFVASQMNRAGEEKNYRYEDCSLKEISKADWKAQIKAAQGPGMGAGGLELVRLWDQGDSEVPPKDGSGTYRMTLTVGGKPLVLTETVAIRGEGDQLRSTRTLTAQSGGKSELLWSRDGGVYKIGRSDYLHWFSDGYRVEDQP